MTSDNQYSDWQEWRDIIRSEFRGRMGAIGAKSYGISVRKSCTIIFLQPDSAQVLPGKVLASVIRIIKETDVIRNDAGSQYDDIAMMGHRFGMVDNSAALKQYLQDAEKLLTPNGQIVFTSVDISEAKATACPALGNSQFQQADLIGLFFNLWQIKPDILKNQATAANWKCEMIYRQDERNYCARLSLSLL